jgi:hypothetical protein
LFSVLIGLGVGDWVRVEEGEITLCYIVPLIIISTSPDRPRPQKTEKQKQKQTVPRADKKSRWVVKYSAVHEESKRVVEL